MFAHLVFLIVTFLKQLKVFLSSLRYFGLAPEAVTLELGSGEGADYSLIFS